MVVTKFPNLVKVNLDNLVHNTRVIKSLIGDKEILAVVKSNAYGHGIEEISNTLYNEGVNWFGIGNPEDGKHLRDSGFEGNILAMGSLLPKQIDICVEYGIDVSISSKVQLDYVSHSANVKKKEAFVQLCIDTGMSRNGLLSIDIEKEISLILKELKLDYVSLRGIWTHFASSDNTDSNLSKSQLEIFSSFLERYTDGDLRDFVIHHSNTGGVVRKLGILDNLVRPGLSLYGHLPSEKISGLIHDELKPVMSLHSVLSLVKTIPEGSGVSYGHDFMADNEKRIGIIPIGYFHGLPLGGSGKISVGIKGRRYKVLGKICMDQTIIDLDNNNDLAVGDEVCLFGDGSVGEPTLDEWAKDSNTTVYDILTSIDNSIMRDYIVASNENI